MPAKKSNKQRYNFLIDSSVYEEFSKVCEEEGYVRSKRIEKFMKKFVEEHRNEGR